MSGSISDGVTTLNFVRLRGNPDPMAYRIERIDRAGSDGIAYRKGAKKPSPFTVETFEDLATAAETETKLESYKAMVGSLVTVIDDFTVTRTNVMVLGVAPVRAAAVTGSAGGIALTAAVAILVARWELELTEVPA